MNRFIRIRLLLTSLQSFVLVLLAPIIPLSAQSVDSPDTPILREALISKIEIWPHSQLPPNGQLLFSGKTSELESSVRQERFLLNSADTVRLLLHKHYRGSNGTSQVVYKPERLLLAEKEYRLFSDGDKQIEYSVKVTSTIDTVAPIWSDPPSYIGGNHRSTSHYLFLALPLDSTELLAIEATFIDTTGTQHRHFLVPQKEIVERFENSLFESRTVPLQLDPSLSGNRITVPEHLILPIGHGRYGGSIYFEPGGIYSLSLRAVDASGNYSKNHWQGTITLPNVDERTPLPVTGSDNKTPPEPYSRRDQLQNRFSDKVVQPLIPRFVLSPEENTIDQEKNP